MGFKAKSSRLQSRSSVIMPEKRVQSEIVLRTPARSWAQSKVHAHWWPRQSVTQYSPELFSYLYKLPLKDYPPFFSTLVLFCRRRKTWKKLCWAESQGRDIFDDTESGSLGFFFFIRWSKSSYELISTWAYHVHNCKFLVTGCFHLAYRPRPKAKTKLRFKRLVHIATLLMANSASSFRSPQ